MMISSPSAGDPYAAAAALDRALRSGHGDDGGDAAPSSADASPDAGPDVVVTLSGGAPASPATYDASGRMAGAPTLDDLGANAPDSLAHASESHGGDDGDGEASAPDTATASPASAPADAPADQDTAVPA